MPIIEYKCGECLTVMESIVLGAVSHYERCPVCCGVAEKIFSTPAQIKMADMEKINRRRQRIKEPMWRDLKTGKLTPADRKSVV